MNLYYEEEKMKSKIKFKGKLRSYLNWPVYMIFFLLIMSIAILCINTKAGLAALAFSLVYLLLVLILFFIYKPPVMTELVSFASEYGQVQRHILEDFAIPYGLLDLDGRLIWMNHQLRTLTGEEHGFQKNIAKVIPGITKNSLPKDDEISTFPITLDGRDYSVEIKRIHIGDWNNSNQLVDVPDDVSYLYTFYMFDNTELNRYIRENEEQKLVVGLIYIDNYDEVLDTVEDVRGSLLLALIDRKINKYITNHHGIMKKLDKDKYYVIIKQKYLNQMVSSRFSLLEDVKTVNVGNDMKVTLSIGIGANGSSYPESYAFAHAAIDMALGRGGDQAVLKDNNQISYFGGKSLQMEKSTRVKARVKAQALQELITTKDDVIIMGHKVTDIDTFGAAIGIYRAARNIGKRAYILIDESSYSIRPYLNMFRDNKDYEPDLFINHQKAMDILDDDTVLVVVDTNRPGNTECPTLLNHAKTIVVLDHHRQASDVIKTATLSYIEPYASSACEMVAEILQYFNNGIKLASQEADCVYAGIIIDTNNFVAKTGIRTFEAAAYLRRCGADVTRVRKIMRNDMDAYKARAEAVRNAVLYRNYYAIGSLPSKDLESPTTVGAQAANELLNINGVKASFVLTKYNDQIFVSARSIDEVNVQIIMERLGGGGHMNIAGAQLENDSVEEAIEILKETIDTMINEGAIG